MPSASNRIRRRKPTRPLGDVSRLTVRLSDEAFGRATIDALVRLARALGVDTERRDDDTDGSYRRRLRLAIQRREAEQARGLP